MATLYDLAANVRELVLALDDCETDDEIDRIIELISDEIEAVSGKGETYIRIIRNWQTDVDAIKTEMDRLTALKKRREAAIDRMKENLRAAMTIAGLDKIDTPLGKWSRRMSPWSCVIIDETKVPEQYQIPQPPKIDKKALLADFKETGEIADGVDYEQHEYVTFR